MPDLPRVSINDQDLYNRAVSSFPGSTNAEKAKNFRIWVRRGLKEYILEIEKREIVEANRAQIRDKEAEIQALVFDPEDNPPPQPPDSP